MVDPGETLTRLPERLLVIEDDDLIAFNDITGPKGNVSGPLTLTTTTGILSQTQT